MDLLWDHSPSDYFNALLPMPDSFFSQFVAIFQNPFWFLYSFWCFYCALKKFRETNYRNFITCSLLEFLTWNTEDLLTEYLFCLENILEALHEQKCFHLIHILLTHLEVIYIYAVLFLFPTPLYICIYLSMLELLSNSFWMSAFIYHCNLATLIHYCSTSFI